MTLFFRFPRRLLSAMGLALVCAIPFAYAVELEGTPVPVDGSAPVQSSGDTAAPIAPNHPDALAPEQPPQPPSSDEHERLLKDNERWVRDNERQKIDHQNWERDWGKNLNQMFGGEHHGNNNDDGPSAMEALIVLFLVIALIIFLCSPLILIGVYLTLRYKAKARHQQALNANIDKLLAAGRDIPVELLRGDDPKSDEPVGSRDKGIRNVFLGAGWLVFLTIMVGFDVGSAGLIWIALGASQVLIWYLNRPNVTEQAGQQD